MLMFSYAVSLIPSSKFLYLQFYVCLPSHHPCLTLIHTFDSPSLLVCITHSIDSYLRFHRYLSCNTSHCDRQIDTKVGEVSGLDRAAWYERGYAKMG